LAKYLKKHKLLIEWASLAGILVALISLLANAAFVRAAPKQTPAEIAQKAQELNYKQDFDASLDLLLGAFQNGEEDPALRKLFRTTLILKIQYQVSEGYRRIRIDKSDVDAYLLLSRTFTYTGDNSRALEILSDGTTENPKSVELWMALALTELQLDRDAEALSVFREVVSLDSFNVDAHHSMAFLMSQSDDKRILNLSSALIHAKISVDLQPQNPDFLDTLATVHHQLGQQEEAIRIIKTAIMLAPDEPFYKKELVRFEKRGQDETKQVVLDVVDAVEFGTGR